jgi:pimeloyl-ACP methyl ester carboxylesterase
MRDVLSAYAGEEGGLRLIRAARDLRPGETAAILDRLRALKVPALVLWGERDTYLPLETVARPLADLLGAQVSLLPGGHFLPLDCPEQVASVLRDFLTGSAAR